MMFLKLSIFWLVCSYWNLFVVTWKSTKYSVINHKPLVDFGLEEVLRIIVFCILLSPFWLVFHVILELRYFVLINKCKPIRSFFARYFDGGKHGKEKSETEIEELG